MNFLVVGLIMFSLISMSCCSSSNGEASMPPKTNSVSTTLPALDFQYKMTRENMLDTLKNWRALKFLRELTTSEHGKPVSELQNGTYFFVSPHYLVTNNKDSTRLWNQSIANRYPKFELDYYEVHLDRKHKIQIIAFVSEKDAALLLKLDGESIHKVTLSAVPFDGEINTLVSLPYERIHETTLRITPSKDHEDMYLLDAVVQ